MIPSNPTCQCKAGKIECKTAETENLPCPRGGVVTNTTQSAEVGKEILEKGGSAVDAAIAILFCESVLLPHTTGIGGSCLMTLYDYHSRIVKTLNARGTAPAAATQSMFEGCPSSSEKGALSVCVPGLVCGCSCAYREYGRLPWADLVKPAAHLAKHGFKVTQYLESVLFAEQTQLQSDESLKDLYVDPNTKRTYKIGETLKNVPLAKTLKTIAHKGEKALYDGVLTEKFVEDIQSMGGIITTEDMNSYKPLWEVPLSTTLPDDHIIYTINTPGSGAITLLMLNIINGCINAGNIETISNWHNIIESFKFGLGAQTELGDGVFEDSVNKFVDTIVSKTYASSRRNQITHDTHQEPAYYGANSSNVIDHGAANIVVFAPDGDAAVVTSAINKNFGAGTMSKSTGIILNDEMGSFSIPNKYDEFGLPSSAVNFIAPGKRPLTSMAPSIVLDKDENAVLGIGSSGGPRSTAGTALVTLRHIIFKEPIGKAIAARRILHQLFPMNIKAETGFSERVLKGLMRRGHKIDIQIPNGCTSVTALARIKQHISGGFDPRRGGKIEYVL